MIFEGMRAATKSLLYCSYCSINSFPLILLSIIHACKLKPIVTLDSFNGIYEDDLKII